MSYSVVILSCKPSNLTQCLSSIAAKHTSPPRVIVVVDDEQLPSFPIEVVDAASKLTIAPCYVTATKPFCFAARANRGIKSAGNDDVILLNDDTVLMTPDGFDILSRQAQQFGVASARILGRCSNPTQRKAPHTVGTNQRIAFVCTYLPRSTIRKVGLLDEQFVPGFYEDDDYCRRVKLAGLQLGVCFGCMVEHLEGSKTLEAQRNFKQVLAENGARFEKKWGPMRTLLTICVPSIFTRAHFLARLNACLSPQLQNGVEVLQHVDAGQVCVGAKRNTMLQAARGDYVVFLDDDDLVAHDYIPKVLSAIQSSPGVDCITHKAKLYHDGAYNSEFIYSLDTVENLRHQQEDDLRVFRLFPYHVNPTRRELAQSVPFPELDHLEDTKRAERMRPLFKTSFHIDEYLYFYLYRTGRAGEQTHKTLTATK